MQNSRKLTEQNHFYEKFYLLLTREYLQNAKNILKLLEFYTLRLEHSKFPLNVRKARKKQQVTKYSLKKYCDKNVQITKTRVKT